MNWFIYLAYGQNIVDIQALEQWPHGEVDINQTFAKVQATGKTSYDFEGSIWTVALGTGIQPDKIAGPRGGMSEYL